MLELFEELEKSTNTGCWKYEVDTQKLIWSKQTYLIHGLKPETDIDVEKAINFYHPEDRAKIEAQFKDCLEHGTPFKSLYRIITNDQTIVYVEASGKAIKENKEIKSIIGTFQNKNQQVSLISSKRRLDKALIDYKYSLNQFFIIAETDHRGVITNVNEKFCEISGYSEDELIGKTHKIVNSKYHPKSFFENMWKTLSSGEIWEGQICNIGKEGNYYWVQTFIFPSFAHNKKITGYTAIRFDITDKMQLELELAEEKEKATFSSQLAAVGELSAGIAHEIANPLSVIMGGASALKVTSLSEEKKKRFIDNIEKSSHRIKKIIKGLHQVAQRSRDDAFEIIPIKIILTNTLEFCEEALKSKGISLTYSINSDDPLLYCNEVKISQILLNLINNAKDAIVESECPEKWIKVIVNESNSYIEFLIIDSGPGIADEHKAKVMEKFFTTKKVGKGTGLGLALVAQFAKEHSGKVYFDDSFSNTCFRVIFPKQEEFDSQQSNILNN